MPDIPIRQASCNGHPPPYGQFDRRCDGCRAGFLPVSFQKDSLRGIWRDWRWFCSQECFDKSANAITGRRAGGTE